MDRVILAASLALATGACANAPDARYVGTQRSDDISGTLLQHLVCEITSSTEFKKLRGPEGAETANYKVVGNLNVKALDTGGAAPSLNFITTLHGANTRTAILGGEVTSTSMKSVVENFEINLLTVKPCAGKGPYQGRFGVDSLIRSQMTRTLPDGVALSDEKKIADFGATIEFSLKSGVIVGPHWVRTHFKGPSEKGLFNSSRTDTSTLYVAFARVDTKQAAVQRALRNKSNPFLSLGPEDDMASAEAAARESARGLITQMILQNLTVAPRP